MSKKSKWNAFREELKAKVDWEVVATDMLKLELVGNPTNSGWVSCRSVDGNDSNPSACYNIESGYYKDHRDGEKAISSYDLLYELGEADDFFTAQKLVATKFNIKLPAIEKGDPLYGVKWQQWRDTLAKVYTQQKQPITIDALKSCDARLCLWNKQPAIALPVHSPRQGHEIVGWMFLPRRGEFQMSGGTTAKTICKTYGEEKGFVCGFDTIEKIMTTTGQDVYWTEGAPDMLAGLSKFPHLLWVTNPHGCGETVSDDQRYAVQTGDHRWEIIADADQPGIAGAAKRAAQLNGRPRVWTPPMKIAEKSGFDYRDYLCENNIDLPLQGMSERHDNAEEVNRKEMEREQREHEAKQKVAMDRATKMLADLGLHILSVDHGGEIQLYSETTKATTWVNQISKLQYDDMVQFLGFRFQYAVFRKAEDLQAAERGGYLFSDFKTALALASTDVQYQDVETVGAGIWGVENKDREPTGEVLIVKHGTGFKFNGKLEQINHPVVERLVADLSIRLDWFNEMILADYIERARNVEWRKGVYKQLFDVVDQWNWENEHMSQLCIGLMFSTWTQALQKWRPIVTLTGESNSGKTVLLETLESLFLGLASLSARSTAAGVLQSLGHCSRPIMLDEFDNGTEQSGLLERFRVASRGQESLYGTAGQTGKTYRIRHIAWLSGIYAASRAQADMNRMINLRILQAEKNARTLDLPQPGELRDLGHKILAGVIVTSQQGLGLTEELMRTEGDQLQSRYRESYSVPYGSLGAFLGLDAKGINDVMTEYLNEVVAAEVALSDAESDQESLLMDIMMSEVRMPNDGSSPVDHASVAEILFSPELQKFRDHGRTKGVGYIVPKKSADPKVAFAGRKMLSKGGLLRGTEWQNTVGILQILQRLPAELRPVKQKQNVAGTNSTCICVSYAALKKWCSSDPERREALLGSKS